MRVPLQIWWVNQHRGEVFDRWTWIQQEKEDPLRVTRVWDHYIDEDLQLLLAMSSLLVGG